MLSAKLELKIQRLMDEYLGAVGSASIVTRSRIVVHSLRDDSACSLLSAFGEVPHGAIIDEPCVVNLRVSTEHCTYGVAIDDDHVLFVLSMRAVAPGVIAMRMKKGAALLRRLFRASNAAAAPTPNGASGAPALVRARD